MHLGNLFTALMSWLSVKSRGGSWLLRIEDLDPQRSKLDFARLIEDDLHWLGLDWDEGGLDDKGNAGPYRQSRREAFYRDAIEKIRGKGLTYPCRCRRSDIMATQAPHQSDGRIVYAGTCRPNLYPPFPEITTLNPHSTRVYVPDEVIGFDDLLQGHHEVNLSEHCGDFVLRRADGAWAYQLAVVVDDALMGVTEVMRGCDLLLSTAQQIYLYNILGYEAPAYAHLPLVCNKEGLRLSKRDSAMSMEELRKHYTPQRLIGMLAQMAGLVDEEVECAPTDLISCFTTSKMEKLSIFVS